MRRMYKMLHLHGVFLHLGGRLGRWGVAGQKAVCSRLSQVPGSTWNPVHFGLPVIRDNKCLLIYAAFSWDLTAN